MKPEKSRLWFISEEFDEAGVSTGYYLARIAAAMRNDYEVGVVTVSKRNRTNGARPASSVWVRQRSTRAVVNSLMLSFRALRSLRRGDIAVVVTNPPALPIMMAAVTRLRSARLVVLVHDVYPDALIATKVWQPGSARARLFDRLNIWALKHADQIIVIGRDMLRLIKTKLKNTGNNITYIPNWADEEVLSVNPNPNPNPELIVQYSGNMGISHGIENLIECAAILHAKQAPVRLEVFGWGLKRSFAADEIARRKLGNITLLEPAPRGQLSGQLGKCDVALILMIDGMQGVSVPCRLYNIMAAGKPVIVAVDAQSEIAAVVNEGGFGWVVPADQPVALANAILTAGEKREQLLAMGARARQLALQDYDFASAITSYRRVLQPLAS